MNKSKTKVYIDGANVFYTQKDLGWTIDWVKTKGYLNKNWEIIDTHAPSLRSVTWYFSKAQASLVLNPAFAGTEHIF